MSNRRGMLLVGDPWAEGGEARRRHLGPVLGAVVLAFCLLAVWTVPAQAATDSLFAAPKAIGAEDCSSPDNACTIAIAVTKANAEPVADSVQIKLRNGFYALSEPTPTALNITFEGAGLTFEAENGTPTLSGRGTVGLISIGATSKVTLEGLELEFGSTTGLGGGIENKGTLTVKNSSFSNNSAASGGAIENTAGATLTVESSTVSQNTATGLGGGIDNKGTLTIKNSEFSGNSAGNGGGTANNAGATLTIENSTFSRNITTSVGGGAMLDSGAATIVRSAIINNVAPINGGGINVQGSGTVTIGNSTIARNASGGLGGGLSNLGTLTLESSTITDNIGTDGAAMASGNPNVTFAADILTSQASGNTCSPANAAFVDDGYTLDDDGTCISATAPAAGSHNGTTPYGSSTYGAVLNAYLGGLASNGGPTKTVALLNSPSLSTTLADPAFDVVPPSFNLPIAIDGGSAACSLADQRGVAPAQGANCDIGAYLLQATKTVLTSSPATVGKKKSVKAGQRRPVTYTATVAPAPDGGAVSFNDGPGNPATHQCAAQSISNGTATCTVSYPSKGVYSVTATYSGDGAANNFAASTSTATSADQISPSAPKKLKGRIRKGKLRLSWGAAKDNVGVTQYLVLRNGKKIKSTKAKTRSVSVHMTGRGGAFTVCAVDAAGNVGAASKKVTVRRVKGKKKSYRVVK